MSFELLDCALCSFGDDLAHSGNGEEMLYYYTITFLCVSLLLSYQSKEMATGEGCISRLHAFMYEAVGGDGRQQEEVL